MPLPLTSPHPPMSRQPSVARDPRRRWALIGSVLLHLLALAALLVTRTPEPPMPIAPSYDLLFENGGSSTPPTAPDQALDTPSEAPAADLPPTPEAEPPAPQSQPAPPVLEPPAPPPDLIQPAPPAPEPAPPSQPEPAARPGLAAPEPSAVPETAEPEEMPQPAPAPNPEPPAVRLAKPEPITPPVTPQTLAPDLPPLAPPTPSAPLPPRPRQQAQQRPAPGTFAAPMDLNFGRAAARAPAPRATGSSRAIDFSLGAPKTGPNKSEAFFDIRAANIGADWAQGMVAYGRRHAYYPEQAAQNGEDGSVEVSFTVNRSGRVENVEIQRRSGSPWLDMATIALWRNAQLAPLPRENTDNTITIVWTTNFILVGRLPPH